LSVMSVRRLFTTKAMPSGVARQKLTCHLLGMVGE
jgi:hypothetical protein